MISEQKEEMQALIDELKTEKENAEQKHDTLVKQVTEELRSQFDAAQR